MEGPGQQQQPPLTRQVAGVILAAGASSRMGAPKATLILDGLTFVARGVATLGTAGCDPVLVVDGAHRLSPMPGARLVHNPNWEQGPLASLQCGLRQALALHPGLDALVVHHVERPRVRHTTITRLLDVAASAPTCLWQPSVAGRSGHPMLWPRALFDALLTLDPRHDTARTLVRGAAAPHRRKLELDDPGVLDNIDTRDDLALLREQS